MWNMKWILFLIYCSSLQCLTAQIQYTEVHSIWDDRLGEWEVIGIENGEEIVIKIVLKWPLQNHWEEWRIESDHINGTIKTKWRNDLSRWELRDENSIIYMNQVHRGDVNRWEIREGVKRLYVVTRFYNNANEWILPRSENWIMSTEYKNDTRDWLIDDFLEESYSPSFKLAMIFISLWQSIPKTSN